MDAALDQNSEQTITARLNTNQLTVERLKINPVTGALKINNGASGTALADSWAAVDGNGRSTSFVVSSTDRKTLVALQADFTGALLIDSN